MTREEAIERLKYISKVDDSHITTNDIVALDMAISALEQMPEVTSTMQTGQFDYVKEPCEDAVSRDAVMGLVVREHTEWDDLYIDIAKLPSVTVWQTGKCKTCKHYLQGERDGSCDSYVCQHYSDWEGAE